MKETAETKEARRRLKKWLKPGKTVFTVCHHVSQSGMTRAISLYVAHKGEIVKLDHWACQLMGTKINRNHGGITTTGCGMDMGFSLVYSLGSYLWPKGTMKAHSTRNGEPDHAGGYALNHRWL